MVSEAEGLKICQTAGPQLEISLGKGSSLEHTPTHFGPWKKKAPGSPIKVMEGVCLFSPTEKDLQRAVMPT